MKFDLTQPTNLVVTVKDKTVIVDCVALTEPQVAALVQHLETDTELVLVRGPGGSAYSRYNMAQLKGDIVEGARSLVITIQEGVYSLGAQPMGEVDLTDMPQRAGAAAAARALATVIETREPPGPARDAKVAALRQRASTAETLGTLRDGLQGLSRQVAGNEVFALQGLHDDVDTGVEPYRRRLAAEPLLQRDLLPVLDFLDGAAEQANVTRKRNEAWRAATEARLKAQLTAAARAEGRSEATEALSDRVAAALGKNDK